MASMNEEAATGPEQPLVEGPRSARTEKHLDQAALRADREVTLLVWLEPPGAEPHAGWCGRGGRRNPATSTRFAVGWLFG